MNADTDSNVWSERGVYTLFDFSKSAVGNGGKVAGKCKLCKENTMISGRINVSTNFLKHVRVCILSICHVNLGLVIMRD